eukprot:6181970-Pleurochrysis_carterae.AAC.1
MDSAAFLRAAAAAAQPVSLLRQGQGGRDGRLACGGRQHLLQRQDCAAAGRRRRSPRARAARLHWAKPKPRGVGVGCILGRVGSCDNIGRLVFAAGDLVQCAKTRGR